MPAGREFQAVVVGKPLTLSPLTVLVQQLSSLAGGVLLFLVGPVHGRVLTFWGMGIARHRVSLGGQLTYTDDEGRFSFEHLPAT